MKKDFKYRICKECKSRFKQLRPLQYLCSYECSVKYAEKKVEDKEKKEVKKIKESLLTHSDYIQLLQKVVNTYIRLRDHGNGCISCDKPLNSKYDAGHYYPTTYQYLRFNEDNIHAQCVQCNRDKHGNTHEYTIRLEKKIGFDRLQKLHNDRHKRLELSIHEIKDLIKVYKQKIKELK